jgi:hypothetical protein
MPDNTIKTVKEYVPTDDVTAKALDLGKKIAGDKATVEYDHEENGVATYWVNRHHTSAGVQVTVKVR